MVSPLSAGEEGDEMLSTKTLLVPSLLMALILAGCAAAEIAPSTPSPAAETPGASASLVAPTPAESSNQAGLPNPASVYCEQQGGEIDIRTDSDGGQYGVCIFKDGSECDEWAFFRGECQPSKPATTISTGEPLTNIYVNDDYGFSIATPDTWTIEEHPDYLILSKPGYRVFLGFQGADEETKPFRTGMPEGVFVEGGSATLLGQAIPKNILVFEAKNKVVAYGGRIKAGDLILVMYLDGVETPDLNYQDINIPPEIISEADQIIASIALKSGDQPKLEFNP
jgi:putative hemolysin